GDLLAGYFCTIGVLAALAERERSGKGQYVATSLLEALSGSLSFQAGKFLNTGEVPPPVGNHHPLTSPMGVYRVKDGFINIAVGNDEMFRRFAEAVGLPALAADERFVKGRDRVKHRPALHALIEPRLLERTIAEWIETLNGAGVACGPIFKVDQVFADPQVQRAG